MDPIHQFQITNIFTFGKIGGYDIALTNSALFMFSALAAILLLTIARLRRARSSPAACRRSRKFPTSS